METRSARKSNAERQAAYRARHLLEGTDQRLNLVLSASAKFQLERLAMHYGVTQRQALEQLLSQAERDLVCSLQPAEQSRYYDGVTR